jgi:hypothetical protein
LTVLYWFPALSVQKPTRSSFVSEVFPDSCVVDVEQLEVRRFQLKMAR